MTISDPFACPAPGCDIFPYDTAQDLADHLLTAHAGPAPAVVPPARPLVTAAVSPAPTVRSFSPGGTRATVAPPAPAAGTANPASEKQISYLGSLLAQHPDVECNLETIDKRSASALIDELRKRPRPAVSTPEPAHTDPPEGFHIHDGTVYKVQISKTGNSYAKMLVLPDDPESEENGEWEYVGKRPFKHLSEATTATLDMARAFGLRTTHCMCCGHHLEKPESVERGIGPVCFGKYF
jgi:Family of unknown function (DUF6011)